MKILPRALWILSVGLVATSVSCGRTDEASSDPASQPIVVRTAQAQIMTLRPSIDLVGTLESPPEQTAILSAQASGLVMHVPVVEGQVVHAGDPIVSLDDRNAQAQLLRAQAAVAEAQAFLALLKRGPLPDEILAARQDARKAASTAEGLQARVDALAPLLDKKEIAEVQWAQAQADAQTAQAEKGAAEARLRVIEAGTRPEQIADAQAKLQVAQADLALQTLAVDLCVIRSPIDGVVTKLPVRQGMFAEPPAALATIIDLSFVWARFRVPAAYISSVREGQLVDVVVPSLPGQKVPGAVCRIAKDADPQTGDVAVFASLENATEQLRPGLGCRVCLWLPEVPNVIAIPEPAIADRDGTSVATIIRDGEAYETQLTLGVQTREFVQVVHGLEPGDVVATEGGYGLPDGCPVTIAGN